MIRQIEMTEEQYENSHVYKVTYFENGLDVAMFRFESLETALNSIRQFYKSGKPL